mgnify:CR=1 FL=1
MWSPHHDYLSIFLIRLLSRSSRRTELPGLARAARAVAAAAARLGRVASRGSSDTLSAFLTTAGKVIWGNLVVYSQGIELCFDKPHMPRRALAKSSAMIYPEQ